MPFRFSKCVDAVDNIELSDDDEENGIGEEPLDDEDEQEQYDQEVYDARCEKFAMIAPNTFAAIYSFQNSNETFILISITGNDTVTVDNITDEFGNKVI